MSLHPFAYKHSTLQLFFKMIPLGNRNYYAELSFNFKAQQSVPRNLFEITRFAVSCQLLSPRGRF